MQETMFSNYHKATCSIRYVDMSTLVSHYRRVAQFELDHHLFYGIRDVNILIEKMNTLQDSYTRGIDMEAFRQIERRYYHLVDVYDILINEQHEKHALIKRSFNKEKLIATLLVYKNVLHVLHPLMRIQYL